MTNMKGILCPTKEFFVVYEHMIVPFLRHLSKAYHLPVEGLIKSHVPTRLGVSAFNDLQPLMHQMSFATTSSEPSAAQIKAKLDEDA